MLQPVVDEVSAVVVCVGGAAVVLVSVVVVVSQWLSFPFVLVVVTQGDEDSKCFSQAWYFRTSVLGDMLLAADVKEHLDEQAKASHHFAARKD